MRKNKKISNYQTNFYFSRNVFLNSGQEDLAVAEQTESLKEGLSKGIDLLKTFFSKKNKVLASELDKVEKILEGSSVEKSTENLIADYKKFLSSHLPKIKEAILSLKDSGEKAKLIPLLSLVAENSVLRDFYNQFNKPYKLGSKNSASTDCVRILRTSATIDNLVREEAEEEATRYISEGADLVYGNFGRVAGKVDRKDFARLNQYRPTQDKVYIFGLAKPPLMFNGKPNITHIQIPTNLNTNKNALSVLHASSDKGAVVIENNIQNYLADSKFERVFVIEVSLKPASLKKTKENVPYRYLANSAMKSLSSHLLVDAENYDGKKYNRPSISDLPILENPQFKILLPGGWKTRLKRKLGMVNETVDVSKEELRVLNLLSNNQELKIITMLTGIREGKIGNWQNWKEALAYETFVKPEGHSLGLHQVTRVTAKLFNRWIDSIAESEAGEFGEPILSFWKKKQKGETIKWAELTGYLASYNRGKKRYKNVKISTICSHLLLKHLLEDQLRGAYRIYGETYRGLEEQPENIITLASAYRSGMNVMVTGAQQYRIAELALEFGLIDKNFRFHDTTKKSKEYKLYLREVVKKYLVKPNIPPPAKDQLTFNALTKSFLIDGYRGNQMALVAHLVYKKAFPGDVRFSLEDFKKAYSTSRINMLASTKQKGDKPADLKTRSLIALMHRLYEKTLGERPRLLLSEQELRKKQKLNTQKIKLANEGLWLESHFQKYVYENWKNIQKVTDASGDNPVVADHIKQRSLRTNEVSKLSPNLVRSFKTMISRLPKECCYREYPEAVLAVAFNDGFFEKFKSARSGFDIAEFEEHLKDVFINKTKSLEEKVGRLKDTSKMQIGPALSFYSVEMVAAILQHGIHAPREDSPAIRVRPDSFSEDLDKVLTQPCFVKVKGKLISLRKKQLIRSVDYPRSFRALEGRFRLASVKKLELKRLNSPESLTARERRELFVLGILDRAKEIAKRNKFSINFAYVVAGIAALETGWGKEKNEWGDPTLVETANNLFSVKANYEQYSAAEYANQAKNSPYFIHHTKEYVASGNIISRYPDGTVKKFRFSGKQYQVAREDGKYSLTWKNGKKIEFKQERNDGGEIYFECYEAFKKYPNHATAMQDLALLVSNKYSLTKDLASQDSPLSSQQIGSILEMLSKEGYATDPEYAPKATSIAKSIVRMARKYGKEI